MKCRWCNHERFYHEIIDEHGHTEPCPCSEFFGSGKRRCNCTDFEVIVHASA